MSKTLLFDEKAFASVISKAYVEGFSDREAMLRIEAAGEGNVVDMSDLTAKLEPEELAKRIQQIGGQIILELRRRKAQRRVVTPYESEGVVTPWRR